jgi:hypothetical protein
MLHTIELDDSNKKAKALLEYLKTLDFIRIDDNDMPTWQKEQLDDAIAAHENGSTQYTSWEDVKKSLFEKYKIK